MVRGTLTSATADAAGVIGIWNGFGLGNRAVGWTGARSAGGPGNTTGLYALAGPLALLFRLRVMRYVHGDTGR